MAFSNAFTLMMSHRTNRTTFSREGRARIYTFSEAFRIFHTTWVLPYFQERFVCLAKCQSRTTKKRTFGSCLYCTKTIETELISQTKLPNRNTPFATPTMRGMNKPCLRIQSTLSALFFTLNKNNLLPTMMNSPLISYFFPICLERKLYPLYIRYR